MSDYEPFKSITRWKNNVMVVTEKIDGTNAQIVIGEDGSIRAGSRTRWITPEDDNFGFARWVAEHADELRALGVGRHVGEWWGAGIQRRYGLNEKRFSLFNVGRWGSKETPPACCHVVPVLAQHTASHEVVDACLQKLAIEGSVAAPGFMKPEGVCIYFTAFDGYLKKTLENDGGKWTEAK